MRKLNTGMALIAMIIGQFLAGLKVGMVEVVMFSGIAIAALVFTLIMFRSVQENK